MRKLLLLTIATISIISCTKEVEVEKIVYQEDTSITNGLRSQITDLQGQVSDLNAQIDSAGDTTELENQIAELENELAAALTDLDNASVELIELTTIVNDLSDQLSQLEWTVNNWFERVNGDYIFDVVDDGVIVSRLAWEIGPAADGNGNVFNSYVWNGSCFEYQAPASLGGAEVYITDASLSEFGTVAYNVPGDSFGYDFNVTMFTFFNYNSDGLFIRVALYSPDSELVYSLQSIGRFTPTTLTNECNDSGKVSNQESIGSLKVDLKKKVTANTSKYSWDIPQANYLLYARANNGSGWNTPWWNKKLLRGHYIQWENNIHTDGNYPGKGPNQNNVGWFRGKSYHFGPNADNPTANFIVTFHRGEDKLSIVEVLPDTGNRIPTHPGRRHLGFVVEGAEYTDANNIDLIIANATGYIVPNERD